MQTDRFEKDFRDNLEGFDFQTLEDSPDSIFALSPSLELIYFNTAWFDFAKENNGEPKISVNFPLGTLIERAISGPFADFYINKFREVLLNGEVWSHEYECSSIDKYRVFQMITYPLRNGRGLIVVNTLKIERMRGSSQVTVESPNPNDYIQQTGWFTQCSNCRRTQRTANSPIWDWVPCWVDEMPSNTSHSICPICYDYYWKYAKINLK